MSEERIRQAARRSRDLDAQRCTTPGHEGRPAGWLIERETGRGKRWVCEECRDACRDCVAGGYVAARLGTDLPGPYTCTRPRGHERAHGLTLPDGTRVWWWTWGGDRLQIRAKCPAEPLVRT